MGELFVELLTGLLQMILEGVLPQILGFLFRLVTSPIAFLTGVLVMYIRYREHVKVKRSLRRWYQGSFIVAGYFFIGCFVQSAGILLCCAGIVAVFAYSMYKLIIHWAT